MSTTGSFLNGHVIISFELLTSSSQNECLSKVVSFGESLNNITLHFSMPLFLGDDAALNSIKYSSWQINNLNITCKNNNYDNGVLLHCVAILIQQSILYYDLHFYTIIFFHTSITNLYTFYSIHYSLRFHYHAHKISVQPANCNLTDGLELL